MKTNQYCLTGLMTGRSLLFISLAFLAFGFSLIPEQAKRKIFGISIHAIGVINGKTVKVYNREGSKWNFTPNNIFTIPADAKDVFILNEKMGVYRNSGKIDIYKNLGPNKWQLTNEGFTIAKDYDHISPVGPYLLGAVKGNEVDFYEAGKAIPNLHFTAPEGAKGIYGAYLGIIVTTETGLDYYRRDESTKYWKLSATDHFDFPEGSQGFVATPDDNSFGIIRNNAVELYTFGQFSGPIHFMDFAIPQ